MDRQLYDYLPAFLHTVQELMEIMRAEQPEFDLLWKATDDVMNERYVDTATTYGVERWETILQITPKASETLEIRKARIKQRIGLILPYTLPWLKTSLAAQFGEDKYSIWLDKYTLYLAVNPLDEETEQTLLSLLESLQELKPANVILQVAFRFLQGLRLGKTFSHYLDATPQCGTLVCGTYPDTATLGESYNTETRLAARLNNYPTATAVCGALACGE